MDLFFFWQVVICQFLLLVFISADTLNPRLIEKFFLPSVGVLSLFFLASAFWDLLQPDPIPIIGEGFLTLFEGLVGIGIGLLLINEQGRYMANKFLTERTAVLADAMRPIDARLLGFTDAVFSARHKALVKALSSYSNLTPLEQEELEDYILSKRRPSIFQTIVGLVSIVLSAFLLEAPAQQAFVWFACSILKLGAPFCS
jgi:hypothetical protein